MSNSNRLITAREIEQWIPRNLQQVTGCKALVQELELRIRAGADSPNLLVSGPPGTGKTSAIKTAIRTWKCHRRPTESLIPCEECSSCQTRDPRYPDVGLFAYMAGDAGEDGVDPFHFCPVDCSHETESSLKEILYDLRSYSGTIVVYLDEVHRLKRSKMEHLLLKPLEEMRVVWIASSAHADEMDPMFLRRFSSRIDTEYPSVEELVHFLAARCGEWSLRHGGPASLADTLSLLAQKSQRNVSECLKVLARAALRVDRTLSQELVRTHSFQSQARI